MPALLIRMSTRPWRLSISAAVLTTSLRLPTSQTTMSALTCFCAASSVARVRPESTTFAPAFCSSIAPARPMPEPPPVIHATLPSSILRRAEQHLRLLLVHAGRRAPALGQHLHRLPHRRTLGDAITPALHIRIRVDVHALALGGAQPRHGRHVGNGVLVAGEPLAPGELLVEHTIEAIGLVLVPVHRVLDLLGRIAEEMVRLAEHWADVAHLRHHPLHHLPALADVLRQEFARLGGEVEEHRARLGEHQRLSARAVLVDHRRDLVVRRDGEELGLELLALADINRVHVVLEPGLLEHDVDLVSVGRGPGIEVDHGSSFTSCLPKFFPASKSIRPRGAFARPCTIDSLYLSRPSEK